MTAEVLILRESVKGESSVYVPNAFSRPRIRFAKSLMDVKAELLRGIHRVEATFAGTPQYIVIDGKLHAESFKAELIRWLDERPALHGVEVLLVAELSVAAKIWSAVGRVLRLW